MLRSGSDVVREFLVAACWQPTFTCSPCENSHDPDPAPHIRLKANRPIRPDRKQGKQAARSLLWPRHSKPGIDGPSGPFSWKERNMTFLKMNIFGAATPLSVFVLEMEFGSGEG
ncbi:hypothetical protein [Paenirhodobacter sp.]|uniref:hypothetical protein n=1 Tax=Paenirhodobacter sp. TaxID=1965326 RepID=UPI003B3F159E